ncbi:hypothetical protein EVA_11775 [gut metagenome]|uniref:Uncharacterized protein n=1 Tax=gut metagenome TaxID=749906 RepID=J9CJ94_9ZZZZ
MIYKGNIFFQNIPKQLFKLIIQPLINHSKGHFTTFWQFLTAIQSMFAHASLCSILNRSDRLFLPLAVVLFLSHNKNNHTGRINTNKN